MYDFDTTDLGDYEPSRLPYYLRHVWEQERPLRGAPFSEQLTGLDSFGFSLTEMIDGMYFDLFRQGDSEYTLLNKLAFQDHLRALVNYNAHVAPQDLKHLRVDVSYDTVLRYTNASSPGSVGRRRRARRRQLLQVDGGSGSSGEGNEDEDPTFESNSTMYISGSLNGIVYFNNLGNSSNQTLDDMFKFNHYHHYHLQASAASAALGPCGAVVWLLIAATLA